MKSLLLSLLISINAFAQIPNPPYKQASIAITYQVIENYHKNKNTVLSAFTISPQGYDLKKEGWSLFFNFPRMIDVSSVSGGVKIEHINGDFYRLTPTKDFTGFKKGTPHRVEFAASAWAVNISDVPAGLYIIGDKTSNPIPVSYTVIPSTTAKQFLRYPTDKRMVVTPEMTFEENAVINSLDVKTELNILPSPKEYKYSNSSLLLSNYVIKLEDDLFSSEASYLIKSIYPLLNKPSGNPRIITLSKDSSSKEGYRLKVSEEGIMISSSTKAGMFYGIQSLLSLIPPPAFDKPLNSLSIPFVEVNDEPRFAHRAFMLDVARNFHSKEEVMKVLDLMALYKLNVFHFHFNDDEGWRIQIPGLPELTEVGGRRGHATTDEDFLHPSFGSGPSLNSHGSGHYTRQEFIDILKYAKERHIQVIPEIETPGHARAAIASMTTRYNRLMKQGRKEEAEKYMLYHPQDTSKYRSVQRWYKNVIDVSLPSTYTFLEKVTDELIAMYKEAGAPLRTIHFGGDEVPRGVWQHSPAFAKLKKKDTTLKTPDDLWYYFFGRINEMVKKKGLFLYGWEEIAMRNTRLDGKPFVIPNPDFGGENIHVDVWNNVIGWGAEDLPYRLANAGYKVVLSPVSNYYFDLAYQKAFNEPGYYWGGYLDIDKPFYFIPFDYYRNSSEDVNGNKVTASYFKGKERLTDYGKSNIVGLQGLLWSETLRTPESMEYMLLPKLLALSERAWAESPAWAEEKDSARFVLMSNIGYAKFLYTIGMRELPRLDSYAGGWNYRIPMPGVRVKDGMVEVNMQIPGFDIRYTTDGTEPTVSSAVYKGPFIKKGVFKVRAFNAKGRGGQSATVDESRVF